MKQYLLNLIQRAEFNVGDAGAGGITLAVFFNWLPHISALLSLVWVVLRLWVTVRDDFLKKGK